MIRFIVAASLSVFIVGSVHGENWPGWRGPSSNGVAPGTGYPSAWSKSENIAWKVELPGRGGSTPAVWDDSIFVTCGSEGKNLLLAYDRAGKEKWRVELGSENVGKHKKGSGANPSPTTDGKHVFAYFKSGDFACVDFSGKVVWQKNLQEEFTEDTLWWDLGTSPVLTRDLVVVAVMQTGPSYLAAFEPATGKLVWKQDRDLGAPEEAAQSYSTPIVVDDEGAETIYVLGADHVTAHEATDGRELWRVGGLNPTNHKYFRSIASPAVSDGILVAPYARGDLFEAIRLGGRGDVTNTHVAWAEKGIGTDVPTPVAHAGRAYLCSDKGKIVCFDIKTGERLWEGQLEKNRNAYSSSPILADGKLYVTREDGKTFVLATDQFKILAENELEEMTVATPVFVDGKILLRTMESLYCVSQ